MADERIWTAALLVIGDEILSGRTQDKNIAQVAAWLNRQGIRLAEVRVVPDDQQRIADAVNALRDDLRLSADHRRDRPDARRHHRGFDRRGVRSSGRRPPRGAPRFSRPITRRAAA